MLTVLASGPLATVQDEGRRGWASIGVTTSGAADRSAAALANRLVGNESAAAVVEATAGGLRVRAERTVLVALTGAPAPVRVEGRAAPFDAPLTLAAGQVLELGMPPVGLRTYLAVRGGVDVPRCSVRAAPTRSPVWARPAEGRRPAAGRHARRGGADRRRGAGAPAVVPTDAACAARARGATGSTPPHGPHSPTQDWAVTAGQQPRRAAAGRAPARSDPEGRAAERGAGSGGDPGAAGRRTGALPRRPPGDRRLPGAGRRRVGGPVPGGPAAARETPCLQTRPLTVSPRRAPAGRRDRTVRARPRRARRSACAAPRR